jgi:hypothetical protein
MCALLEMNPPKLLGPPDDGDRRVSVIFPGGRELADAQLNLLSRRFGLRVEIGTGVGHIEFRQMLAKIGHCMTVAKFGLENFVPFLDSIIRSKDGQNLNLYVGSSLERTTQPDVVHYISHRLVKRGKQKLVVWRITLFGCLDFPSYEVVAGRLLIEG